MKKRIEEIIVFFLVLIFLSSAYDQIESFRRGKGIDFFNLVEILLTVIYFSFVLYLSRNRNKLAVYLFWIPVLLGNVSGFLLGLNMAWEMRFIGLKILMILWVPIVFFLISRLIWKGIRMHYDCFYE